MYGRKWWSTNVLYTFAYMTVCLKCTLSTHTHTHTQTTLSHIIFLYRLPLPEGSSCTLAFRYLYIFLPYFTCHIFKVLISYFSIIFIVEGIYLWLWYCVTLGICVWYVASLLFNFMNMILIYTWHLFIRYTTCKPMCVHTDITHVNVHVEPSSASYSNL